MNLLGRGVHDHVVLAIFGAGAAAGQHRERRVVGDRVEPWPEAVHRRAAGERPVGLEQGLLNRLVGVGISDHLCAVREQGPPVPVDDRLERRLRPESGEFGQPGVALHPQRQPGQP